MTTQTTTMTLQQLIDEARRDRKWLRLTYQDLHFTPDDLEKANANGQFRWGVENFELVAPRDVVDRSQQQINRMIEEHNKLLRKLAAWDVA